MKKLLFAVAVLASALTACGRKAAVDADAPLTVIIETDLGNDVDDALALDLLYKYQDRYASWLSTSTRTARLRLNMPIS